MDRFNKGHWEMEIIDVNGDDTIVFVSRHEPIKIEFDWSLLPKDHPIYIEEMRKVKDYCSNLINNK